MEPAVCIAPHDAMRLTPRQHFDHKMPMPRRLTRLVVEKPWGRTDIPAAFGDFDDFGGRRIGEIWFTDPDGIPPAIMVKFLFTSERLSIQVHPDDAAAGQQGLASGKDECWFILSADPGAELGVGLKQAATRDQLRRAALDGSIVDMIDWRPATENGFVYNRAGTIHAIGGGLTLVEVQQNVDCTYRLHDYGRPRELHLDEGLAVSTPGPVRDARDTNVEPTENMLLVDGPHFRLLHLSGPDAAMHLPAHSAEFLFTPLSQGCSIYGEPVELGDCVAAERADGIELVRGARALLCWSI